jgi:hypothetical protein
VARNFRRLINYDFLNLNSSVYLIVTFPVYGQDLRCMRKCLLNPNCYLCVVKSSDNMCYLYNNLSNFIISTIGAGGNVLYQKMINNAFPTLYAWNVPYEPSLTNYWPINKHTKDLIAGMHMTAAVTTVWDSDRFSVPLSSIKVFDLNTYYNLPPNVYFTNDFTITAWYKT